MRINLAQRTEIAITNSEGHLQSALVMTVARPSSIAARARVRHLSQAYLTDVRTKK
jgi:hypothetical protein